MILVEDFSLSRKEWSLTNHIIIFFLILILEDYFSSLGRGIALGCYQRMFVFVVSSISLWLETIFLLCLRRRLAQML